MADESSSGRIEFANGTNMTSGDSLIVTYPSSTADSYYYTTESGKTIRLTPPAEAEEPAAPQTEWLRSLPLRGQEQARVSRDTGYGLIGGVSLAQAVEALGHGILLDQTTLEQIRDLGNARKNGVKSRFTHPGLSNDGTGKTLGRVKNLEVRGDKVVGDLWFVKGAHTSPSGNLAEYVLDMAENDPDLLGLSVVISVKRTAIWQRKDGTTYEREWGKSPDFHDEERLNELPVARVTALHAVDVVDEPAANRDGMFSAELWATNRLAEGAFEDIDDLLERYNVSPEKAYQFAHRYFAARGYVQGEGPMPEATTQDAPHVGVDTDLVAQQAALTAAIAETQRLADQARRELMQTRLQTAIEQHRLSGSQALAVRAALGSDFTDERMAEVIDAQVAVREELSQVEHPVKGIVPRVSGMMDSMDKFTVAFDALWAGTRPPSGIKPLEGIRDAYMLMTGDYELNGVFHADRVSFANVKTTDFPGLVANVMNKRVSYFWDMYDKWWSPICIEEDSPNLQDLRWHKVGGIGEMPIVAEGAAYQETEWSEDWETAGWDKRGHYIGLTLEAIDKDDTGRLRRAPQAMALSAWRTLGLNVSRLFTVNSGAGPVMRDTNNWFHASHGNVGTSALSLASIKATTLAMMKFTDFGNGERLGDLTRPKYILVPVDLEYTAEELLMTAVIPSASTDSDFLRENAEAYGNDREGRRAAARRRIITIPHWTDANDWAMMADPMKMPSIGLGYRFGRVPEIFSQQDPNSGLMFTNDTMPIKVRWFWSLGIIDARGAYKHNVA